MPLIYLGTAPRVHRSRESRLEQAQSARDPFQIPTNMTVSCRSVSSPVIDHTEAGGRHFGFGMLGQGDGGRVLEAVL